MLFGLLKKARRSFSILSRRAAYRRPVLETLEDRTVPSAYKVITTADVLTGNPRQGSLRDAITFINNDVNSDGSSKLSYTGSDPTRDEIDFAITADSNATGYPAGQATGYDAATGVATITPHSALPAITNAVFIDGYTQGYNPDGTPTPLAAKPNSLLGPSALGSTDSTLHPEKYGTMPCSRSSWTASTPARRPAWPWPPRTSPCKGW
jgi:hypothetical protein